MVSLFADRSELEEYGEIGIMDLIVNLNRSACKVETLSDHAICILNLQILVMRRVINKGSRPPIYTFSENLTTTDTMHS